MKKVISILLSLSLIFSSMIMLTGTAFANVNVSLRDDNYEKTKTVAVPKQGKAAVTIELTASAMEISDDNEPRDISDNVWWGFVNDTTCGVEKQDDKNTTTITIPSTATAGTVQIEASIGDFYDRYTLTLTKEASVATSIGVEMKVGDNGSYTAYSDVTHSVEVGTNIYLKATVYDQYGVAMPTESDGIGWTTAEDNPFQGDIDVTGNPACLTVKYEGMDFAKKMKATLEEKSLSWENNVTVEGYVKRSHNVTFANATKAYTYGDTVTDSQVASCTTGTSISYSSSDESKVEVDSTTGALTIKKATGETPVTITATVAATSSYAEGKGTYTVIVNPKELEITGLTAVDRNYIEGSTEVNLTGGTLTGRAADDTASDVDVVIPKTGTVATADASDEKKDVTVTKPTLTGTKASNYTLKDITGVEVKISKQDSNIGNVSVSSPSTIYNTTELKNIALAVANPDSGTKTAGTATLDAGQTLQVGTHDYTWTFTPSNSNYKSMTGKVSITVVPDTLTRIQLKAGAANYKMAYLYGDAFNLNGAIVQAVYSSGATKDLAANELTYSEEKLAVGQTTETISYTENGVTKNLELGITVDKASHGNVTVFPTVEVKFGKSKTLDLSEYIESGDTLDSTVSFDDTDAVLNQTDTKILQSGSVQIATINDQKKAGKKGAAIFTVESANYEDYIITVNVTILDKFELTVTPPQAVASLVYNGSAQELITPATVAETGHGTIEYKLGADGTYGAAIPTATDASSSYTVYYKVKGDDDYADVAETSVNVTIGKKDATVAPKNVTITKGQTPTFELEWSGIVGNDTATISGAATPSFTLTDAEGKAVELDTAKNTVGTYKITWSNPGAVAFSVENNYNVTKNTEATLTVTEAKSYGGGSGSSSSSKLEIAKNEAKADVKTQTESQKYEDNEAAEVKAIKEQADKDIAAAKTVEEVEKIKAEAEAKIEAVPTAEEKADIAKVSGVNKQVFIATSKKSTLHGKKAVKVSWVLPKGIDVDGFVVYRSTKKGSFGTKPYFTTKKSTYKNNKELKTGTTYYYKVKGYKVINGEKVYTGWSTTAYRTIK